MKCGERHTALLSQAMLRAKNPGRQTALLPGVTSSHRSTGRLMAVIGDLDKSDESVSISVSVERQRALWLLERETVAGKQVALRHWATWLAACPRAWAGGTSSQSFRGGPARLLQEYPTLFGAPNGRTRYFDSRAPHGHGTPTFNLTGTLADGRCKALPAPHPPSKTLVGTHISAQPAQHCAPTPTFATSPAFACPPSTIATASSLLQLPERRFCARIDAV